MANDETTRKSVILPVSQVDALQRMADAQRRRFSDVLREAVERYTGVKDTVKMGPPMRGDKRA